jgi:pimeloyl-ACP methyl ester carboxylesterase
MFAEILSDRGHGRTLVYLPGIDGSGELLLGTAARLEERFRLIRVRYRLGTTTDHRTYQHLASSVIEAVALRGADRMILLAESFGGAVALRAALDFPAAVEALALVNTFVHYRRRARLAASRLVLGCTPPSMIALGRRLFARRFLFGTDDRSTVDAFVGGGAAGRLDPGYPSRLRMIHGLDLRRDLERVRQPVALFASEGDRIVDAVRQAEVMVRLLPDVELEILAGRGHVVLPAPDIDWPARLERLGSRIPARGAAV